MTALAQRDLAECEAVIERGLSTFIEVASTLLEIRDRRLYKMTHETFDAYCQERWGWGRAYAYRMIASGEVVHSMNGALADVSPMGDILPGPTNERQTRALEPLKSDPAAMAEAWQEAVVETNGKPTAKAVEEAVAKRTEQKSPGLYTSDSDDWWTPQDIIDRVLATFDGTIDLDPCSNLGTPNVPATVRYTVEDDGLSKPWVGRVYMNPPYGDVLPNWIEKMVQAFIDGEIDSAVALVPARTDTRWFRTLRPYLHCFIFGRLKFSGTGNSAPFPSMAVYLGPEDRKFIDAFSPIGDVFGVIE